MGREVVVAITGGRLDFGTWERIFYGEFDGRRWKRVLWPFMTLVTKGEVMALTSAL
jgi:thiamine phosphate synthase YjbQ (UPF0047 family)